MAIDFNFDENSSLIKRLKNFKNFLLELLSLTKETLKIILKNKLLFLSVLVIYGVYSSLQYIAYDYPKRQIIKYYSLIDDQKILESWKLLNKQFKVRWKDSADFVRGYSTLTTTILGEIKPIHKKSLFDELLSFKKEYEVQITVIENFKKENIYNSVTNTDNPEQKQNILWLRLRHSDDLVESLKNDSLTNFRNCLQLIRRFKKVVSINLKFSESVFEKYRMIAINDWEINNIETIEQSLILGNEY